MGRRGSESRSFTDPARVRVLGRWRVGGGGMDRGTWSQGADFGNGGIRRGVKEGLSFEGRGAGI
jgi:hypothetical protein